jgi:hypothetical protein
VHVHVHVPILYIDCDCLLQSLPKSLASHPSPTLIANRPSLTAHRRPHRRPHRHPHRRIGPPQSQRPRKVARQAATAGWRHRHRLGQATQQQQRQNGGTRRETRVSLGRHHGLFALGLAQHHPEAPAAAAAAAKRGRGEAGSVGQGRTERRGSQHQPEA